MTITPGLRKLTLMAHVTSSVGWLGAVAAFLVLAVVALSSRDTMVVRAVYIAAEPLVGLAILPLAVASFLTGLASSLLTAWGLLRHYWVIFKLVLNLLATLLLVLYTRTVGLFAGIAADPSADLTPLRSPTFLIHSLGALVVLLTATGLAVYKPRGMTRYGQRRRSA